MKSWQIPRHRDEDPRVPDGVHHGEEAEKRFQEGDVVHATMILDSK